MRVFWVVVSFVALGASFVSGQQINPSAPSASKATLSLGTKGYPTSPDATTSTAPTADNTVGAVENCKDKSIGTVTLSFIENENGIPVDIGFQSALGNSLDMLAERIVRSDRFKPITHDSTLVAVPQQVKITFEVCTAKIRNAEGKKKSLTWLKTPPEQEFSPFAMDREDVAYALAINCPVGPNGSIPCVEREGAKVSSPTAISHPVVLHSVAPEFPDQARMKKIGGICLLSLIVDAQGRPRDVRVMRPLGYGLDQNAVAAVRQYRFKPAMKNGKPVAAQVGIEVSFNYY